MRKLPLEKRGSETNVKRESILSGREVSLFVSGLPQTFRVRRKELKGSTGLDVIDWTGMAYRILH